ncbi:AraC family transcriptional regulator [Parapedobacter soli]|uniref:AraC family transcriptional regulator n=1 Tax=Parapedobacter soli TaxID=416955 RepID=UPI0021C68622|nr:AraC family transcriptional regulator [Parapedobacter soli]
MERQLTIHFTQAPDLHPRELEGAPNATHFPMKHARCSVLEHTDAVLYQQEVDRWPFTVRLFTLDAKRGQQLTIRLHDNGVYFSYLFAGQLNHLLGGGTPFRLRAPQYCGCYLPRGDYPVNLPPGKHELFLFGFPYGYLIWLSQRYAFLRSLAEAWKDHPGRAVCLPKITIRPDDRRLLAQLARLTGDDDGTAGVKAYVVEFVARYQAQLSARPGAVRDGTLLAAVRAYIERHYADPQAVKLATVAAHFGHGAPGLRKAFIARYGRSMADLVSACRVAAAEALLADTELPLATIAERVGFANAKSLDRAFGNMEYT